MKELEQVGQWMDEDKGYSIGNQADYEAFVAKRNQSLMKYYTISFPGEFGQHVVETWSTTQILDSYFPYWTSKMVESGHGDEVSEERCLDDWIVVHWAVESDQFGRKIHQFEDNEIDIERSFL